MKIAIVGTGISGLSAGYFLSPHHDVVIYEKSERIGGHTRTITIKESDKALDVDTGFIVFNSANYPQLNKLFSYLDVATRDSEMSFGVKAQENLLEYSSTNVFAQRLNFVRPSFYKMLFDIVRFNKRSLKYIKSGEDVSLTTYLERINVGSWFKKYYILPMGAAIWSSPISDIKEMSAQKFLQFFYNHGLLSVKDHPQWFTVTGGSKNYLKKLIRPLQDNIRINSGVEKIRKRGEQVSVTDSTGDEEIFDRVILACHADESGEILDSDFSQKKILQKIEFRKNQVVVHKDISVLPKNKKCWASWNYMSDVNDDQQSEVFVNYLMNKLQDLPTSVPIIVSLNPTVEIDQENVFDVNYFSHPVLDMQAQVAQQELEHLQGNDNIWVCGAYLNNGFHEDGLASAINVAKAFGVPIPWE